MKVGSFVYATNQGLGILAKDFYDAGVVTDVMVIAHGSRAMRQNWYPNSSKILYNLRDSRAFRDMQEFCKTVDLMLFFETPFEWRIMEWCKSVGIRTALMPMHECMPNEHPEPDITLCPSELELDHYLEKYPKGKVFHIPVPVPDVVAAQWRLRERAETFVHNGGHGGLRGRNGTRELLQAIPLVQSDAKFIIRSQIVIPDLTRYRNVQVELGDVPYGNLYSEGDVFLFPEKFNGLSLPLQEAYASGMLVMATDRYPTNRWLPDPPLICTMGSRRSSVSGRCLEFDEAIVDPKEIAATIDAWYGQDITQYSQFGKEYGETNSWANLKPRYLEALS